MGLPSAAQGLGLGASGPYQLLVAQTQPRGPLPSPAASPLASVPPPPPGRTFPILDASHPHSPLLTQGLAQALPRPGSEGTSGDRLSWAGPGWAEVNWGL